MHRSIPMILAGLLCAGPWAASSVAAQCSTNPADANDAPACPAAECSHQFGPCPATGATANRNGAAAAPAAATPGSFNTQTPNLTPPRETRALGAEAGEEGSARPVGPVPAPSEFELFAEDAAGRPLPVFGRQLFSQVPTTFAPMDHIPVPSSYALGPGDQLLIRAWGKIDLDATVTVDSNGQIFLPKVGTLSVAGLRYEQIEGYLRSAIAHLYKDFELNVTMGQLRSIQIFVLGSARQPGVYTVSSLSTLVNALFASGGPSATGSMRHIRLFRADRLLTELDVYDLLRRGDKSHDAQLLSGDVVYIPPVGPQIAIMGSVNEPGIYELKDVTALAQAVQDAGGLSNTAATDRALLERIENHRRRRVDDFPLDALGLQRPLRDGDLLEVFPISPQFDNAVTLRGNVAQPGRYVWHQGMKISDLIPSREALMTRSHWNQENHLATRAAPGENAPPENAPIDLMADLIRTSAEINWDYASIERLDEHDLSTNLIAFHLGNAIDHPESQDNRSLEPGDVVTIFSRQDLPLPEDRHAAFVSVSGEVNAPGVYRIRAGETLRDLVERAGGLTAHSYLYASQLLRVSTRRAEEEQMRLSVDQMQRELTARYAAAPTLNAAGATEQQAQLAQQQAAIARLAAIRPIGRVVLDMNPRASTVADIPAFPLEDGDSFLIPPRFNTVQVLGAVYNENAFRYQPRKRVAAYLNDAGGPTRQADVKRIFLIRADGTVISAQSHSAFWRENFTSLTLLPGDSIMVPSRLKSSNGLAQQLPFLMQILSQTALTGAVIGTSLP